MTIRKLAGALVAVAVFAAASAQGAVNVTSVVRGSDPDNNITWVSLSLYNPMSRELNARLEFTNYIYRSGQNVVEMTLPPIPPGASRELNLAIPMGNVGSGVLHEPGADPTSLNVHASVYKSYSSPMFLYVAEQSQRPSDDEMDAFTYRTTPGDTSSLYGASYSSGSSSGTPTTRTLSAGERNVTHITPENLPENWLCYIPIQNVIISESVERRLSAPQRQALETWLAAGGNLTVFGGDRPGEERRQHGTITRVTEDPMKDPSIQLPRTTGVMARRVLDMGTPYQEDNAGGRGGAFVLATLFLVVVGPVNYFYFQRRGDIRKLIVTVPLISMAFCSLIAVYFVLTQGFNRLGGTISVTMVNEQNNRAMTFARHSLLTGLYPMGGFRFTPETHLVTSTGENQEAATFDLTRERRLTEGLFRPGIGFEYATLTPHTTRERMMFDREKGTVRNGYELPVKGFAVYRDGRYFTAGEAAPGAEVQLRPVDEAGVPAEAISFTPTQAISTRLVQLLGGQQLESQELESLSAMARETVVLAGPTTGTVYAALFDGIPKTSDSGVEISDGENLHIVVGQAQAGEAQE